MRCMYRYNIEPKHYEYLYIQRGSIASIKNYDKWKVAFDTYHDDLYELIRPFLPDLHKPPSILEIGSGLGAVSIMLNNHYKGKCHLELIDGKNDDPVVVYHNETFNNHTVSEDFLNKNGVNNFTLSTPNFQTETKKDLIVSFSAYCFHIEPKVYLKLLEKSFKPNTVCIFNVRRSSDYLEQIRPLFKRIQIIDRWKKGDIICLER